MDKVENSASTLTTTLEADVLSRRHCGSLPAGQSCPRESVKPFKLGESQLEMRLNGPRDVKLSGGLDPDTRILVDNYILMGVFPSSVLIEAANLNNYYQVKGTADAVNWGTNGILFRDVNIPLESFGPGGTSSIAAIRVTDAVEVGINHKLDIRALDCGGHRELSDIYLLFQ